MLDTMRNITVEVPALDLPDSPATDYERVRRIIAFISERWRDQPSLEAIAEHVGISTTHVHHLFRRWCGLTPKAFLQAITLDNAKALLADSASVLDATYEVGLSGPGRLHDLFVTHEAMTPGDFKTGGAGLTMRFGFHPSPFGEAILVATERGLAGLDFVDDGDREAALADMSAPLARRIFDPLAWLEEQPLRVVLIGTDFEVRVWQTLLRIPLGRATTYSEIAGRVGKPSAARAVGAAVGKNPLSFVVPCHRVLGRSGALTGYHWGLTRKQAILGWEAGRLAA
jgi:AraC family transcriptional regulator, regulatory protein of adaptative response / methylated-DNA-[protein]-cysteine methyltransferase